MAGSPYWNLGRILSPAQTQRSPRCSCLPFQSLDTGERQRPLCSKPSMKCSLQESVSVPVALPSVSGQLCVPWVVRTLSLLRPGFLWDCPRRSDLTAPFEFLPVSWAQTPSALTGSYLLVWSSVSRVLLRLLCPSVNFSSPSVCPHPWWMPVTTRAAGLKTASPTPTHGIL